MTISKVMFSSKTQEWSTPLGFFESLDKTFQFTLDPCATPENAKCRRFFTPEQDGLKQKWTGRVFMNPPYGRGIGAWVKKAWETSRTGVLVVCLLPARTDTSWWHDYCLQGDVRFLRGRLRFKIGDVGARAPFPSAVVTFWPMGMQKLTQ